MRRLPQRAARGTVLPNGLPASRRMVLAVRRGGAGSVGHRRGSTLNRAMQGASAKCVELSHDALKGGRTHGGCASHEVEVRLGPRRRKAGARLRQRGAETVDAN